MAEQPVPLAEPHPDEDALVEVALGHAAPALRDVVTGHLSVCAPCRRDYDDVADAVELVLPAVPRIAPPPNFEGAALTTLSAARGSERASAPVRGPWPSRRTVLWAAAAAVLGLSAGAGATAYLSGPEQPPTRWSAPLVTSDGTTVGYAAPSYDDRGDVIVVDVTGGQAGRTYTCLLRLTDGSTRAVGTWILADDRPNSWVVPVADGEVAGIDLVGESGRTWATAQL